MELSLNGKKVSENLSCEVDYEKINIPILSYLILILILNTHCIGSKRNNNKDFSWLALLGIGGNSSTSTTGANSTPPPIDASTQPVATVNEDTLHFPQEAVKVSKNPSEVPPRINGTLVPIGKIYDVGPQFADPNIKIPGDLHFKDGHAVLEYSYDAEAVHKGGFSEEFSGFYQDKNDGSWHPVDDIKVDTANKVVKVYTSHFTPFVLTAAPSTNGNQTANPPSCITADSGVIGLQGVNGKAKFSIIGGGFKIYQDRNYIVKPGKGDFQNLGFEGALAIATCQGDSWCGDFEDHKKNKGSNYIQFNAHTDIDVYVMYDTHAGADRNDVSNDPAWLKSQFSLMPNRFILTTGSPKSWGYRIYKKTYQKGQTINLGGNVAGTTIENQSNYWVVIKRGGSENIEMPASALCETSKAINPPWTVQNVRAFPGVDKITLLWQNPKENSLKNIVIRRSLVAPPTNITDGDAPTGRETGSGSYVDEGLTPGNNYFYSIFAVNQNGDYHSYKSIYVELPKYGLDTDNDGIADGVEAPGSIAKNNSNETYVVNYPGLSFSLPNNEYISGSNHLLADSDGDGINDGDEIANGTFPTNPDSQPPVLTRFELLSEANTLNPNVSFKLEGSDNSGITQWVVLNTPIKPMSFDSRWTQFVPEKFLLSSSGENKLYAYARDAAGNVSAPMVISVTLPGINVLKNAYVTYDLDAIIESYNIDAGTGMLFKTQVTPTGSVANSSTYATYALVDPTEKYLIVNNSDSVANCYFSVYSINNNTGLLSLVNTFGFGCFSKLLIHPSGNMIYALNPIQTGIFSFNKNNGNIEYYGSVGNANNGGGEDATIDSSGKYFITARNDKIIVFKINSSFGLDYHNYLSYFGSTASLSTGIVFSKDEKFLYSLRDYIPGVRNSGVDIMNFNKDSGEITTNRFCCSWATGKVDFVSHQLMNGFYRQVYSAGEYKIFGYSIDNNLQEHHIIGDKSYGVGKIIQDKYGKFVYLTSNSDRKIIINPVGENNFLTNNNNLGLSGRFEVIPNLPNSPTHMALHYQHDVNDPPTANAGEERWVQFGNTVQLFGQYSSDPDAVRCNADTTKYKYNWEVVQAPVSSSITTNSLQGNNTPYPFFRPDVKGDYYIRLNFVDDPGNCMGSAKSSAATVKIKVGTHHVLEASYIDAVGTPPNPSATFHQTRLEYFPYGFDSMWLYVFEGDYGNFLLCPVYKDLFKNYACGSMTAAVPVGPFAAVACNIAADLYFQKACETSFGKYKNILACVSPELTSLESIIFCNLVVPPMPIVLIPFQRGRSEFFRGHFFVKNRDRAKYTGWWDWWDYN